VTACRFCGAALPSDALFCGTCGRTVAGPGTPRPRGASEERPGGAGPAVATACPQCGTAVQSGDVFCRECGFVVSEPRLGTARDTTIIPRREPPEVPMPTVEGPLSPPMPTGAPLAPPRPEELREAAPPRIRGLSPEARPTAADPIRVRFVLQFSTGESVIATGSGLIGRSPSAQPGERVDQLVVVGDAGKSVSKTHVEFGQEDGEFWVSDRWSTNGTVLRVPGSESRRCEPGHRYRVPRGTRIEIGEQFFVVS